MIKKALGLLETYGYIGAVEAADACLKTANIELIDLELVGGGLVTIKILGDVSAVKASIAAGDIAASRVGKVISTDVIARMGEGLEGIIYRQKDNEEIKPQPQNDDAEGIVNYEDRTINLGDENELINMKVVDLRKIARRIEGISIEKSEIKFAKKKELIEALTSYFKREVE